MHAAILKKQIQEHHLPGIIREGSVPTKIWYQGTKVYNFECQNPTNSTSPPPPGTRVRTGAREDSSQMTSPLFLRTCNGLPFLTL